MVKQKMLAKVHYNPEEDSFELYIYDMENYEWGFSRSTKCRAVEGDSEPNFIHFSFMKELLKCIQLGYEVIEG